MQNDRLACELAGVPEVETWISYGKNIKKVLVVDDEKALCDAIVEFLESTGYDVESIADPTRTLELLEGGDIDLVILDITMKGIDGLGLLGRIAAQNARQEVIVMTGNPYSYTYGDIIEAGAAEFIVKPFHMSELKAKLERINRERDMQVEVNIRPQRGRL